jgi:hypothetical protein
MSSRKTIKQMKRDIQSAEHSAQLMQTGDRSERFNQFISTHFGITKEEFLGQLNTEGKTLSENLLRKVKGLQLWNEHIVAAMIDYYKHVNSTGLNLQNDLILLEADLVERRLRMQARDPHYDPLEDEVLQAGLKRKADMMQQIAKINLDVQRLNRDMEKDKIKRVNSADTVTVSDMVINDD